VQRHKRTPSFFEHFFSIAEKPEAMTRFLIFFKAFETSAMPFGEMLQDVTICEATVPTSACQWFYTSVYTTRKKRLVCESC
jgi:hypothetical protein